MQTRREQVQAHRFVTRRIVSAMLSGEPETTDLPMRRLGQAIFASVMIGTILLAILGVIGILTGAGSGLEPNTLVVQNGTGATFVYIDDGTGKYRLHPTLNYASARLVLGVADPVERNMSESALRGIQRGPTLGIPNAPQALPRAASLVGAPWHVCNLPGVSAQSTDIRTRAVIGQPMTGGEVLGGDDALYVTTGDRTYLISHNRALPIIHDYVAPGLSFNAPAIRVSQQFINAVPAGPELGVKGIEDGGKKGDVSIGGQRTTIGWIYRDENGQYYLVIREGLLRIGEVYGRLRLVRDNQNANQALEPRPISTTEASKYVLGNAPRFENEGYPLSMPVLKNDREGGALAVCATYGESASGASVTTSVFRSLPPQLQASTPDLTPVRQTGRDVVSAVDEVVITGGSGSLVQPLPAPGSKSKGTTTYLVTDEGIKYPLAAAADGRPVDAVTALGYGGVTPASIPLNILDLLPTGGTLDGNAARSIADAIVAGPSPTASTSSSP